MAVTYNYPPLSATLTGGATEAKQDVIIANQEAQLVEAEATNDKLDNVNVNLENIVDNTNKIGVFAVSSLVDTASTPIPASASLPLQLFASTGQTTYKILAIDDIGAYMGLYTGAAASETLLCALPLGGGEVEVNVLAGTRISIKALENSAITNQGKLIINLLG